MGQFPVEGHGKNLSPVFPEIMEDTEQAEELERSLESRRDLVKCNATSQKALQR